MTVARRGPARADRARLLVTGAGTGAANNLIRSLRAHGAPFVIVGCHDERFVLRKSEADRNWLVPPARHGAAGRALADIIRRERVDLVLPTDDDDVALISRLRRRLPCRVFLPGASAIRRCQDKLLLASVLRSAGVPAPRTWPVRDRASVTRAFRALGTSLWCRMRAGQGSMAATPVTKPAQAWSWITYWRDLRRVPPWKFTLSEYLPGRDFAAQSLWLDGRLVLVKTYERLAYVAANAQPSGVSSIAAVAKTVVEPRVVDVAAAAVRAVERRPCGAYSIDLKEDASGRPCVTEINAGRFISGTPLFDLAGRHNMALTYVRLALGRPVDLGDPYDRTEGDYMVRDLDTLPGIFRAEAFFDGIQEARW